MDVDKVLFFINTVKGVPWKGLDKDDTSLHIMEEIYTMGNCGNFAVVLCLAFPGSIPYYVKSEKEGSVNHTVTKIGSRLYDITGDVTNKYYIAEETTIQQIISEHSKYDFINNYSFGIRGPIV